MNSKCKLLVIVFLLSIPVASISQYTLNLTGLVKSDIKISDNYSIPKNTKIKILRAEQLEGFSAIEIQFDNKTFSIEISEIKRISIDAPSNVNDFWISQRLKRNVYKSLLKNGYQHSLRKELREDGVELLQVLESKNYLFDDKYLEAYLSQLVFRLLAQDPQINRLGTIIPKILKDPNPQAYITPNGIIFISTGLLSLIDSENELLAILAHEISHYYLDHFIVNQNKLLQKQKRAEFWALFATGMAAAADVYIASKNDNYVPGLLTEATAVVSSVIAANVVERFGINFSRSQELEADECAEELLINLKIKPGYLSSVFAKLRNYYVEIGDYEALLSDESHPSLDVRIEKLGAAINEIDTNYLIKFSNVLSDNAWRNYMALNYDLAKRLVEKNIRYGVAIETDYLLLAKILISKYDNLESNSKALELLNQAKGINVIPINQLEKYEAILHVRLNHLEKAKSALASYKLSIEAQIKDIEKSLCLPSYLSHLKFFYSELDWVKTTMYKIK